MKKLLLFLLLAICTLHIAIAQDHYRKINIALRYLKLGNTLREAQQYDLSEKYLRQGLQIITEQGDRYWEAATYENMGLLFKDQDKPEDEARYFNKALALYRQLK